MPGSRNLDFPDWSLKIDRAKLFVSRLSSLFLTDRVQKDSDENDGSLDKLHPEWRYIQEVQSIAEHPDGEHPKECSDHISFPAKERSATDHHRGDNVQLETGGGG